METKEIKRGDIYYVPNSFHTVGSEQRAGRPALVVSNDKFNATSPVVTVVYLTTRDKGDHPTHVKIKTSRESTALCEHIYTLSKERIGNYVSSATAEEMQKVNIALTYTIDINDLLNDNKSMIREKQDYEKICALQDEINYLTKKCDEYKKLNDVPAAIERDLYKSLYEQLLSRLLDKEVRYDN